MDPNSYVTPGSDEEHRLVNLLRSTAKVPWKDLFKNVSLPSSSGAKYTDHPIPCLDAFFKTEQKGEPEPSMTLVGAQ